MSSRNLKPFQKTLLHYGLTMLLGCFIFCSYQLIDQRLEENFSKSFSPNDAFWIIFALTTIPGIISIPLLLPIFLYYHYLKELGFRDQQLYFRGTGFFLLLGILWSIALHYWLKDLFNEDHLSRTLLFLSPYTIAAALCFLLIELFLYPSKYSDSSP